MSESLKSGSLNQTEYEISASSSNNTTNPLPYLGEDLEKNVVATEIHQDICRTHTNQSNCLSVKDIYGDLDSENIRLQRNESRKTILSELAARTADGGDHEPNVETLYENLPDTAVPTKDDGKEFCDVDPELITWNGSNDPEDPRNWSFKKKAFLTGFVSIYTLVSPMSSSMLSPAMDDICQEFHISNNVIASMVVSIQILAWALGPLILSPLSESDHFGRKTILDISIWLSFFFNLGCALSQNTTQIMIFRFIGGLFGSAPLNVGAGVLSDLFNAENRVFALAGFSLAPLLGPVIAPLIAGFIIMEKDWRWVFYVLCIFNGAVAILGTLFYKETYSPRLLKLKANRLRKQTGNNNLHTIYEIADGETIYGKMYLSITRPIYFLFMHPMIVGLGSFMAFTYGFMYLMIVSFPSVFKIKYGFDKATTGLMYIPMGIGFVLGVLFWTVCIDKVYKYMTLRNGGVAKPEYRLPCLMFTGIIVPIGLIWYGWSAQKQLHWIMPGIGSAIFAFGLVCVFQCTQTYLIDMNTRFAASSVAAAALFRSLFGFSFPLFANKMYNQLNYGWGNTMCAFIGLVLGVPFPICCYLYGEKIRTWANKRMEKNQLKRDHKNLQRLQKQKTIA